MVRADSSNCLWIPILTHYRFDGEVCVDVERMVKHARSMSPYADGFLIGGSTGDGWDLDDTQFRDLLNITNDQVFCDSDLKFLIGCLRPTAVEVIVRGQAAEVWVRDNDVTRYFKGLAICPQIDSEASQAAIRSHYEKVLTQTVSEIAVYQLPQVTECEISPQLFSNLTLDHSRITFFKDTSGMDRVAESGIDFGDVVFLRGAEGEYSSALQPTGPYHGWLLSTGNGFAPQLRQILDHHAAGFSTEADQLSRKISEVVRQIFKLAESLPEGNAFSNCNRAIDHINAYGRSWRVIVPPLLISGNRMPENFIASVAGVLEAATLAPAQGYCEYAK